MADIVRNKLTIHAPGIDWQAFTDDISELGPDCIVRVSRDGEWAWASLATKWQRLSADDTSRLKEKWPQAISWARGWKDMPPVRDLTSYTRSRRND